MTGDRTPARTDTMQLAVGGMHCANCARGIERRLLATPGVQAAHVSFALQKAQVLYDPGHCHEEDLLTSVMAGGYSASRDLTADLLEGPVAPRRLAFIAVLTGVQIVLVHAVHASGAALPGALGLAAALQVLAGGPFYRGAYHALRGRAATMDVLVALGITAAFGGALLDVARARPMPMLDSAPMLATIILAGKSIEAHVRRRATRSLSTLAAMTTGAAHRLTAVGQEEDVPLAQIAPGDRLVIRPGERIPVDGQIEDGRSAIDESVLTGESVPVARGPGDAVISGATNGPGLLRVRATRVGEASYLARILAMVAQAQLERPPVQRLADRIAAIFVPSVVALALVTAALWGLVLGPRYLPVSVAPGDFALDAAIGVLVIACPCALGLATPLAILAGSSLCLERGILTRRATALEMAARTRTVVLDKTGTLTAAAPQLEAIEPAPGWAPGAAPAAPQAAVAGDAEPAVGSGGQAARAVPADQGSRPEDATHAGAAASSAAQAEAGDALLRLAGAALAGSTHPLARAVAAAARQRLGDLPAAQQMEEHAGLGVTATIEGHRVVCGQAELLRREGLQTGSPDAPVFPPAPSLADRGLTVLQVAVDGRVAGALGLGAPLRPEARACVQRLHALGMRTRLLTGDREAVARAVADALGIESVHAAVPPEGKRDVVAALVAAGDTVAMVGDGINDAPALAAASLGIAVSSASDLARDAGDVVLVASDLSALATLFAIGRATLATIHQNFALAIVYNAMALPVAAGALYPVLGRTLPPEACAMLMALSSLTVVANSLRLRARQF